MSKISSLRPAQALLSITLLLLVSACGARDFPMPYSPTQTPMAASPGTGNSVVVARVSNERTTGHEDLYWFGTIRGGYGNPLFQLNANQRIDEVVQNAFSNALSQRGLLASGTPTTELLVTIRKFDANRYARLEATVDFRAQLRDRSSGRILWEDEVRIYNLEGSILALDTGVMGRPEGLQIVMLRTMNQAIDRLVDNPAFRAAIAEATPPAAPSPRRGRAASAAR